MLDEGGMLEHIYGKPPRKSPSGLYSVLEIILSQDTSQNFVCLKTVVGKGREFRHTFEFRADQLSRGARGIDRTVWEYHYKVVDCCKVFSR